jgi:hypothetical protein
MCGAWSNIKFTNQKPKTTEKLKTKFSVLTNVPNEFSRKSVENVTVRLDNVNNVKNV